MKREKKQKPRRTKTKKSTNKMIDNTVTTRPRTRPKVTMNMVRTICQRRSATSIERCVIVLTDDDDADYDGKQKTNNKNNNNDQTNKHPVENRGRPNLCSTEKYINCARCIGQRFTVPNQMNTIFQIVWLTHCAGVTPAKQQLLNMPGNAMTLLFYI